MLFFIFRNIRPLSVCLMFLLVSPILQAQSKLNESDSVYAHHISESFRLGEQGEYTQAIEMLNKAIQANPKHPMNGELLNNIAGLYQLLGQNDQALLTYYAAIKRSPQSQTIHHNHALLLVKLNKTKEAMTEYAILINMAPRNEVYRYQRAMLYLTQKEYDLARSDLDAILILNDKSLKTRMGYALLETLAGNYDKAERLYDYLIDKLPTNPEVYAGRARMFLAKHIYGFALRDINKAFELSKPQPTADLYILRGEINLALNDQVEAHRDFELAKQIDPGISSPLAPSSAQK